MIRPVEKIEQLRRLHYHLLRKPKWTANEYASQIGVTRATFYRLMDNLQSLGAEIGWRQEYGCYCYLNDFRFEVGPM